jgi:hypothetical protein
MIITVKASSIWAFTLFLALSQQPRSPSEQELKRTSQRMEAVSMIQQAAAEATHWDNKNAAIQVLADAADLLWTDNPDQATRWLSKAWESINQVSELPQDERQAQFFTRSNQSELRTMVLNVARRHDAELYQSFLKKLQQDDAKETRHRGAFDDRTARSEQLLRMARQSLEADPEAAVALAERSLVDGISYSLQTFLTSLRKKNVALANHLFDLAITRFTRDEPDPSEGQILAGYLFQSGITFSASSSGQTILALNPAQQNLPAVASDEPQRAKRFLTAVFELVLARPVRLDSPEGKQRAQQILVLGNQVIRRYETFAPELTQSARGFLAQLQRQLSPDAEAGTLSETTRVAGNESTKPLTKEELYDAHISELENSAEKERNAMFKNVAYGKAAVTTKPVDYERGKRIAERIDDAELRDDVVSFVLYRAALFLVEQGDTNKASEIAPQIKNGARRAVAKIVISKKLLLAKVKDSAGGATLLARQRAFDMLADIERDLKGLGPSSDVARILLARSAVLGQLDQVQGLVALDQAIEVINKLDEFDFRVGAAPDLGVSVSASSGATVARPRSGFDLRSAIDPLVEGDFEDVVAAVGRLRAKELNGFARLETAKTFLRKTADAERTSAVSR